MIDNQSSSSSLTDHGGTKAQASAEEYSLPAIQLGPLAQIKQDSNFSLGAHPAKEKRKPTFFSDKRASTAKFRLNEGDSRRTPRDDSNSLEGTPNEESSTLEKRKLQAGEMSGSAIVDTFIAPGSKRIEEEHESPGRSLMTNHRFKGPEEQEEKIGSSNKFRSERGPSRDGENPIFSMAMEQTQLKRRSTKNRPGATKSILMHLNSKLRDQQQLNKFKTESPTVNISADTPPKLAEKSQSSVLGTISNFFRSKFESFASKPSEQTDPLTQEESILPVKRKATQSSHNTKKKKKSIVDKRSSDAILEEEVSSLFQFEDTDILALKDSKNGPQPKDPMAEGTKPLKPKKTCMIRYNSRFKFYWDGLVAFMAFLNGFYIPFHIAFEAESEEPYFIIPRIFSALFGIDMLLQFRVTVLDTSTGEEISSPKEVFKEYVFSFGFLFDLLATVPIFLEGNRSARLLLSIQLLKMLSMSKLDLNFNQSEMQKLIVRLVGIVLLLMMYINLTACLLYYIASQDKVWVPSNTRFMDQQADQTFYDLPIQSRFLATLYSAILVLSGNEIDTVGDLQTGVACVLTVLGSLIIANIFGAIAVISTTLNRKNHKFQEKIDTANSSMFNMKIPLVLQDEIRQFMVTTQNNLDNQKELDNFMQMISPSLRNKVTKYIFTGAIAANPVFQQGSQDLIDLIINDVTTLLFLPEDNIIRQGQQGENLFLIAKGECSVWVKDHMRKQVFIRQLCQGDYFGEISILTDSVRTASVKSQNYCTMACIHKRVFYELCNNFPDILIKMKKKALEYNDPWKEFKMTVLREIEYFRDIINEDEFYNEIQFLMEEEFIDKGSELITAGEQCKQIIFIVQGKVQITAKDSKKGAEHHIDYLTQGDILGQYSVLFDEESNFTAKALSNVRILTLTQDFFIQNKESIEGIEEAIEYAEEIADELGVPICDYKVFSHEPSLRVKLRRARERIRLLRQADCEAYKKLLSLKPKKPSQFDKSSSMFGVSDISQGNQNTKKSNPLSSRVSARERSNNNYRRSTFSFQRMSNLTYVQRRSSIFQDPLQTQNTSSFNQLSEQVRRLNLILQAQVGEKQDSESLSSDSETSSLRQSSFISSRNNKNLNSCLSNPSTKDKPAQRDKSASRDKSPESFEGDDEGDHPTVSEITGNPRRIATDQKRSPFFRESSQSSGKRPSLLSADLEARANQILQNKRELEMFVLSERSQEESVYKTQNSIQGRHEESKSNESHQSRLSHKSKASVPSQETQNISIPMSRISQEDDISSSDSSNKVVTGTWKMISEQKQALQQQTSKIEKKMAAEKRAKYSPHRPPKSPEEVSSSSQKGKERVMKQSVLNISRQSSSRRKSPSNASSHSKKMSAKRSTRGVSIPEKIYFQQKQKKKKKNPLHRGYTFAPTNLNQEKTDLGRFSRQLSIISQTVNNRDKRKTVAPQSFGSNFSSQLKDIQAGTKAQTQFCGDVPSLEDASVTSDSSASKMKSSNKPKPEKPVVRRRRGTVCNPVISQRGMARQLQQRITKKYQY